QSPIRPASAPSSSTSTISATPAAGAITQAPGAAAAITSASGAAGAASHAVRAVGTMGKVTPSILPIFPQDKWGGGRGRRRRSEGLAPRKTPPPRAAARRAVYPGRLACQPAEGRLAVPLPICAARKWGGSGLRLSPRRLGVFDQFGDQGLDLAAFDLG